jgi:antitoxin component of MazEF toxin-antitoxin module
MIKLKTTKSPFKSGNSMALIIPDAIVKFFNISTKSRITIKSTKSGFNVKIR